MAHCLTKTVLPIEAVASPQTFRERPCVTASRLTITYSSTTYAVGAKVDPAFLGQCLLKPANFNFNPVGTFGTSCDCS